MLDPKNIKTDSDNTAGDFFTAEIHESVIDARKERDKSKAEVKKCTNEIIRLTKENERLKSDSNLLEEADLLRNIGAGILSVFGGLTLIPLQSLPSFVQNYFTGEYVGLWSVLYAVCIIGGIVTFVCGVWLRRRKRKTNQL